MIRRTLLLAALLPCLCAIAEARDDEVPPTRDPARPAVGEWIGNVSWNAPIVTYAWTIYPDGSFTSGRMGRGQNGEGTWSTSGAQLTLKYADGFRYEGVLAGDDYAGTAYRADGVAQGGFSMHRARPGGDAIDEAQDE